MTLIKKFNQSRHIELKMSTDNQHPLPPTLIFSLDLTVLKPKNLYFPGHDSGKSDLVSASEMH